MPHIASLKHIVATQQWYYSMTDHSLHCDDAYGNIKGARAQQQVHYSCFRFTNDFNEKKSSIILSPKPSFVFFKKEYFSVHFLSQWKHFLPWHFIVNDALGSKINTQLITPFNLHSTDINISTCPKMNTPRLYTTLYSTWRPRLIWRAPHWWAFKRSMNHSSSQALRRA